MTAPNARLLAPIMLVTLALAPPAAMAGEIARPSAQADFTWKPTECVRPVRPHIRKDDPSRQALLQDYALKVAYYIDCLKGEAQRDFDRAQTEMHESIQRALQTEVDKVNDAMDSAVRSSR